MSQRKIVRVQLQNGNIVAVNRNTIAPMPSSHLAPSPAQFEPTTSSQEAQLLNAGLRVNTARAAEMARYLELPPISPAALSGKNIVLYN